MRKNIETATAKRSGSVFVVGLLQSRLSQPRDTVSPIHIAHPEGCPMWAYLVDPRFNSAPKQGASFG